MKKNTFLKKFLLVILVLSVPINTVAYATGGPIIEITDNNKNLVFEEEININDNPVLNLDDDQLLNAIEEFTIVDDPDTTRVMQKKYFQNISLIEANLPNATKFDEKVFNGCVNLRKIDAPKLIEIEKHTFRGCKSITNVNFPSLTTAGIASFSNCTGLKTANLPLLKEVTVDMFNNCVNLENLNIPSAEKIWDFAFKDCKGIKNLDLPNLTTFVGKDIFLNCSGLQKINIPKVSKLTKAIFKDCIGLTEIIAPNVTIIEKNACENCKSLKVVNFPNVTQVSRETFKNCLDLEEVYLPNAREIQEDAFKNCPKLKKIVVPADVQIRSTFENKLYKKDENGYEFLDLSGYKKFNREVYDKLIEFGFTNEEILNKRILNQKITIKDLISVEVGSEIIKNCYRDDPNTLKDILLAFNTFNKETYDKLKSFGITEYAMLCQKIGKKNIDIDAFKSVGANVNYNLLSNIINNNEIEKISNKSCYSNNDKKIVNTSEFRKLINTKLAKKYGFVLSDEFYENATDIKWSKENVDNITEEKCKDIIRNLWSIDDDCNHEEIEQIINFIFGKDYVHLNNKDQSRIDVLGNSALTRLKQILITMERQQGEVNKIDNIKYFFANNENACDGRLNEILRQSSIILDSIELKNNKFNYNEDFKKSILMQFKNEWFNEACQKYSETAPENYGVHYATGFNNTFYDVFNINSYDMAEQAVLYAGKDRFGETQGQAAEWFLKAFDSVYDRLCKSGFMDPTLFLNSIIESDKNANRSYDIAIQTACTFDEYCDFFGKDKTEFKENFNTNLERSKPKLIDDYVDVYGQEDGLKEYEKYVSDLEEKYNNWFNNKNELTLEEVVQSVYLLAYATATVDDKNAAINTVKNLIPELLPYITGENKKDYATELFTALLMKNGIIIK